MKTYPTIVGILGPVPRMKTYPTIVGILGPVPRMIAIGKMLRILDLAVVERNIHKVGAHPPC